MNLPNKLTMLRVILIPIFVLMFEFDVPNASLWALIIFVVASATDWFDGYLARRDNLVTNFGILMDPLADKLLVAAAMIYFVGLGLAPAWVVVTIISREFLVTSIRLVAAGTGKVIAADKLGKYKTATQMIWISLGLFFEAFDISQTINHYGEILVMLLMWIVLILTVWSGINYVIKNKEVFSQ